MHSAVQLSLLAATASVSLGLLGTASAAPAAADADAKHPNVIFILTDDLGYGDVGAFFQNLRRAKHDPASPWHMTPHLDAFAAEGMQLRDSYCAAPVCAPSRSSLLTGVTQGHAQVRDNQFDSELARNHTLGSVMKGAGYATAAFGKWGLQGLPGQAGQQRRTVARPIRSSGASTSISATSATWTATSIIPSRTAARSTRTTRTWRRV